MTDAQERELNALRHQMDLTHCPDCREPYDLEPCNARHARIQQDRLRVKPSLGVSLKAVLNSVRPLTCNCDVPNQVQCELHGPRQ